MNEPGQKIQAAVAGIIARRAPKHPESAGDHIVRLRALLRRVVEHGPIAHPPWCDFAKPRCKCMVRDIEAAIDAELAS